MCIDHSFIVKTGDPNKKNINPEKLGTLDITGADEANKHGLFEFFACYVQKVHSNELIRKTLKLDKDMSFIDIIGPNNIVYVIAVFKNSQEMWDQNIRMRESGMNAMGEIQRRKYHQISQAGVV
jgi:hypothetical protein